MGLLLVFTASYDAFVKLKVAMMPRLQQGTVGRDWSLHWFRGQGSECGCGASAPYLTSGLRYYGVQIQVVIGLQSDGRKPFRNCLHNAARRDINRNRTWTLSEVPNPVYVRIVSAEHGA
jgi:hypothetical protein